MCLLVLLAAGVGLFGQLIHSQADVRSEALLQWANGEKERQLIIEEFTKVCLIGKPIERDHSKLMAAITIEQCADLNGFKNLSAVVRQADMTIKSYAWPLSLVLKPIG